MTKFIAVISTDERVHITIPVDFIMSIAPLFAASETIAEASPVEGKTLIKLKSTSGIAVDHEYRVVLKAIAAASDSSPMILISEKDELIDVLTTDIYAMAKYLKKKPDKKIILVNAAVDPSVH